MPGASPAEFIPNDTGPGAAVAGMTSQLLLADLVRVAVGVPVLAESVEFSFAIVPSSSTEKASDVGENDNAGSITVRVTCKVASV